MVSLRRRTMVNSKSTPVPTPSDYVAQDNLLMLLDGIDNVGTGTHASTVTKWVDLTGNGHDLTFTGTVGANYMKPSRRCVSDTAMTGASYKHFEICMETNVGTESKIISPHGNSLGTLWFSAAGILYIAGSTPKYAGAQAIMGNDATHTIRNTLSIALDNRQPSIIARNGEVIPSAWAQTATTTWGSNSSNVNFFSYTATSRVFNFNIYSVRWYDRVLTAEEIAQNFAIDKARFGVPDNPVYTAPYSITDVTKTTSSNVSLSVTNGNHVVVSASAEFTAFDIYPWGTITNGKSVVPWIQIKAGDHIVHKVKNLSYTSASTVNGTARVALADVLDVDHYVVNVPLTASSSDTGVTAQTEVVSESDDLYLSSYVVQLQSITGACTVEFDVELWINDVKVWG